MFVCCQPARLPMPSQAIKNHISLCGDSWILVHMYKEQYKLCERTHKKSYQTLHHHHPRHRVLLFGCGLNILRILSTAKYMVRPIPQKTRTNQISILKARWTSKEHAQPSIDWAHGYANFHRIIYNRPA